MSLQKYVHQVRPRVDVFPEHVNKIQYTLSEAGLTVGELFKYDWRIDLFIKKMSENSPFETEKGMVVLKQDPAIMKALKDEDRAALKSAKLFTQDGQPITFGKLVKSTEFGGGGRGSGGGSSSTTATESAQCVYLQAIWNNPKTEFTPAELNAAFAQTKVNATVDQVLDITPEWVQSSILTAKVMKRAIGSRDYVFHRGSDFVSRLEKTFNKLNGKEKAFGNLNKWTPADIWMIDPMKEMNYRFEESGSIDYLNNMLLQAYAARDIIGVSLKKTSKPKLTQVNYKKPFKSPRFSSVTLGKRDFLKSKDGYIFYNGGEIQFRTYPAFQCEIIGKSAKHGKVDGNAGASSPMGLIMKAAGVQPHNAASDMKSLYRKNKDEFYKLFLAEYLQHPKTNKMDLDKFTQYVKGKDDNWLVSKFLVCQVFNRIRGREQKFLEGLFRYAKSQDPKSAVHLKVS